MYVGFEASFLEVGKGPLTKDNTKGDPSLFSQGPGPTFFGVFFCHFKTLSLVEDTWRLHAGLGTLEDCVLFYGSRHPP